MHGVALILSYPVDLAFRWFVYPIATCGFVLELPGLRYLALLIFERFVLVYPAFTIFEPSLLVLGFPMYVSLSILVLKCWVSGERWWVTSYLVSAESALFYPLLLCILLLSFCLPFSHFLSLLHSPLLFLCSPLSLLFPILSWF